MPMSTDPSSRAPRRLFRGTLAVLLGLLMLPITWVVLPAAPASAGEVYPVPASGSWSVEGAGFGHGKGLSQWGAQARALAGQAPHQIIAAYYPGTTIGSIPAQNIRVQLTSYAGSQVVFGPAGEALTARDAASGQTAALSADPGARYRVTIDASSFHIDQLAGSTWSSVPINGQFSFTGPIEISAGAGTWVYDPSLNGAGRKYRNVVRMVRSSNVTLQAVNELNLEQYLYGVVPRESPSSWHTNALQAQAIAARSYAKAVAQSGKQWDICDTTQCQVYGGSGLKQAGSSSEIAQEASSTSTAVNATNGLVVFEPGGSKVAFTQFSASNGGYSVDDPARSYLEAAEDPYSTGTAPGDTASRWTATLAVTKVQEQCPSGGLLQSFEIVERDGKGPFGGRIKRLRVNCTTGSADITNASTLAFGMRHHMWRPTGAVTTGKLARVAGADRYATAAQIATTSFSTTDTAIVVRGDGPQSFPDGLAASFLGGVLGAPTLLTAVDSLPQATRDALSTLHVKAIKVLGGTSAVSADVVSSLQNAGYTVERIGGDDRYATAALVAQAGSGGIGSQAGKKTAVVSSGAAFPDALAAGGIVYGMRFPQLLTEPTLLSSATASALSSLGIQHVLITGGTTAVSGGVEQAIKDLGLTTQRIGGATRYETAVMLADLSIDTFGFDTSHVDIATGEVFPDALTGGPHAGKAKAATILTAGGSVPDAPCNFLQRRRGTITSGHIYGGTSAVNDSTRDALERCLL
jgi:SpoIID/LytB domain protein